MSRKATKYGIGSKYYKGKTPKHTKSFTLLSGTEEAWYWRVSVVISPTGGFWNKGRFTIHRIRKRGEHNQRYYRAINSMGECLFCGEIDWRVLEEHHPDKEKLPDFTVTLCANCHRKIHWDTGYCHLGGDRD